MKKQYSKRPTSNHFGANRHVVEVHLQSKYSSVDPEKLAPSLLSSIFSVSHSLFRPFMALIIILGVALLATGQPTNLEAWSQKFFSFGPEDAEKEGFNGLEIAARLDSLEDLILEKLPSRQGDILAQEGKMKFIAGLVAMYRPNIKDCGAVAKEIVALSTREGIDPFYVAAVISVESSFRSAALSRAGALGLMQLMPATAKELSSRQTGNKSYPRLKDPHTNIELGIAYLKQLESRYHGNRFYALSAYNWGPANVDKVRKGSGRIPKSVQKYANTIVNRSKQWARHYAKAKASAKKLRTDV